MLDLLADPQIWASFAALAFLEIVLGIDNIIFISIVTERLPQAQRASARRIGLILALLLRLVFLYFVTWIIGLQAPVFEIFNHPVSWRDLILVGGGLFLLYKATIEVHAMVEEREEHRTVRPASFAAVIGQIMILDLVFSLDSVITAVGMTDSLPVMYAAVIVAVGTMLLAAGPISEFVHRHPTVKMLALSFLLLVGVALIAEGLQFHIPRGYLYFAIAFSLGVEVLNLLAKRTHARRAEAKAPKTQA